MQAIIQMVRFGREFRAKLECGHGFRASLDEARRDQLFIGKRVECKECTE